MANSDLFLGVKNMVAAKLGTRDIKLVLGSKLVYPLGKTDIQNAVVTCDSATYNGSSQVAQNIVVTLRGNTLVSGTDYTVTSNTGGTNAGSYSVTVSGAGNYEGSASGTFVINKAAGSVTTAPTANSLTYNGNAQTLVSAGSGTGTMMYKLNSGSWVTSIPSGTNATSYTVYYKASASTNYNESASGSVNVNIAKVTPTVTAPTAKSGLVYNGNSQALVNAGSTNFGTLKYSIDGGGDLPYDSEVEFLSGNGYQYINTNIVPNSSTGIKLKVKPDKYNYLNENDVFIVGTRNNTSNTRWGLGKSGSSSQFSVYYGYTSYAHIGVYNVYGNDATISLNYLNDKKAYSGTKSVTLPTLSFTPTNGIRIFGSSGVNASYSKFAGKIYYVKISQGGEVIMDLIPVRKNGVGYMYDKISGNLYGNSGTGSFTYGSDVTSSNNNGYSTNIPSGTNASSYTVYYKVEGNSNINDVAPNTVIASIAKVTPTVTVPTAKSGLVYNGNSQALVNAGSTNFGTLKYSLDGSSYSTTVPSGTNASSYTVYYKVEGDSNINDIAPTAINVTISRANITPYVTIASWTYGNTASNPTVSGNLGDGTVTYYYKLQSDSNWSTTKPTNGGSYDIRADIAETANYNSGTCSNTFAINKANSSLSFTVTNLTVGVGGTAINAVTVNAGDGTVTYSSNNTSVITVDNNGSITGTGVGNAVITADISQTNNYNSASATYTADCKSAIVAKYNITSTSSPTRIASATTNFTAIEIDGVKQSSVTTRYTFSTTGEHTVKYILKNPTTIDNNTFMYCIKLTSIVIPSGVTSIGSMVFDECSCLTSVTIPDSVTSIGGNAFYICTSLRRLNSDVDGVFNIPSGVTSIGASAFYQCGGLTSINIPDSVTSIGSHTFYQCGGLTSINIPDSVTSIGEHAFDECRSLTSATIPDSVTSIGSGAFQECASLTSIDMSDSVTSIGDSAFKGCRSLTSVTIPDSVTSIGDYTFEGCTNLRRLNSDVDGVFNIPSGVTSIGDYAFQFCSSLTSIDIPDSVTSIGNYAFGYCTSLTSIDITDSVTSIGDFAFSYCSGLTSMTVDSNNTVYDSRNNCNGIINTSTNILIAGCKNTVILDSVTSIGSGAFQGCASLTSIDIPDSVTSIGDYAFSYCSKLTSIDIPDSVITVGSNAFRYCTGLTSATIGSSVTSIGDYAFSYCSGMTTCTIGSGVTSIGERAFYNCNNLTSITSNAATAPTIQSQTFRNVKTGGTLYVPSGSTGYDTWMQNSPYYLGYYSWTKVEQ